MYGEAFKVHAGAHPAVRVFTDDWDRTVEVQIPAAGRDVTLAPGEARELAKCLVAAAEMMENAPERGGMALVPMGAA